MALKKISIFKVFHKVAQRVVSGETDLYNFKKDGIFSYKYSPFSALFFTLLMVSQFYINNAIQGNINAILFFLMIASVYFVLIKKWDVTGSILLSLAVAIKIIPLAILGIFFFKKRCKAFLLTLLFLVISLVIPFLYWGYDVSMQLYIDWFRVLEDKNHFPFFKWTNQSPFAIWFYLTNSLLVAKVMSLFHFVLALGLLIYSWIKKNDILIISSCLFAMLLMPPVVWLEYHLILVFPLYYCLCYFFQGKASFVWKALLFVRIVYAYTFSKLFFGREFAEEVAASGQHYFALMFLIVLVFAIPKEFQCGRCQEFFTNQHFTLPYTYLKVRLLKIYRMLTY